MYEIKKWLIGTGIIIFIFTIGVFAGYIYAYSNTNAEFEESYREAKNRIEYLERELRGSEDNLRSLREENSRIRKLIEELESDRSKLTKLNSELETIIRGLKGDNRELRIAIERSQGNAENIEDIIGGFEDLLQEIGE